MFFKDPGYRTSDILCYKKTVILRSVFTMWRDVGKGDLHEALQGQEGQTGTENQM